MDIFISFLRVLFCIFIYFSIGYFLKILHAFWKIKFTDKDGNVRYSIEEIYTMLFQIDYTVTYSKEKCSDSIDGVIVVTESDDFAPIRDIQVIGYFIFLIYPIIIPIFILFKIIKLPYDLYVHVLKKFHPIKKLIALVVQWYSTKAKSKVQPLQLGQPVKDYPMGTLDQQKQFINKQGNKQ